ncbi:MAG: sugar ABC transporter ATP-binding protein [Verrucomicrobia bacterium]|nr:sugar ABC transporter ATP-binding protein [Verrucomicrobiota bacterium]MBV9129033.1 sugar ABC transporter ATP-binding protein [Verrucomicrobiota bacterium]
MAFLSVEHISKTFPGVRALDDVSVNFEKASVHALMGENGAGKSTLGKIIAGVYTADQGVIKIEGKEVKPTDPRSAQALGIALVHQELAFCPNMTVAENLLLGGFPTNAGFMDWGKLREKARALLHEIGADIDVDTPLAQLTTGQEQMVQIAGAVGVNARIIIFDEPTSSLSTNESEHLFELMGRLKAREVSMIYVSHRMDEIFQVCDTITVLRDGKHVATESVAQTSRDRLIRQMVGREVLMKRPKHLDQEPGEEILRVENLSSTGKFENVSFNVRRGEIVGMGGLVGAGRTEVATAIFGLDPRATGNIYIKGQKLLLGKVNESMRRRIALLPEDRKRAGLVLGMSIMDNVSLAHINHFSSMGFVDRGRELSEVEKLTKRLRVKAPSLETITAGLSGGNQQKVALAKWMVRDCDLLIVDEPTRGVDVGAKAEIYELLDEVACQGLAILMISSELPELLNLARRVVVLREGFVTGELPHEKFSQEAVLELMA